MLDESSVVSRRLNKTEGGVPALPKIADILNVFVKKVELLLRGSLETSADAMVVETTTRQLSSVLEDMSMPAMIGMVEVGEMNGVAMVSLDLDLTNHLVDLGMGGKPDQNPAFTARFPTPTDSQICQPVVNLIMSGFRDAIMTVLKVDALPEMVCTTFEHDPMMAAMAVEHAEVAVIKVSLDIGEAARSGMFDLIVPMSVFDEIKACLKRDGGQTKLRKNRSVWSDHMIDVVMDAKLEVNSVVDLSHFSIAELSRLNVGEVLPLPPNALADMSFVVDMGGETAEIAKVKLGAFKKNKAVKMLSEPDREFFNDLEELASEMGRMNP